MIVNSGYVVRMLGFSKRFCHLLRLQDQDMMCSSGERLNFGDKGKARRIYGHCFQPGKLQQHIENDQLDEKKDEQDVKDEKDEYDNVGREG